MREASCNTLIAVFCWSLPFFYWLLPTPAPLPREERSPTIRKPRTTLTPPPSSSTIAAPIWDRSPKAGSTQPRGSCSSGTATPPMAASWLPVSWPCPRAPSSLQPTRTVRPPPYPSPIRVGDWSPESSSTITGETLPEPMTWGTTGTWGGKQQPTACWAWPTTTAIWSSGPGAAASATTPPRALKPN